MGALLRKDQELLIRVRGAGNGIERPGNADAKEIIIVIVIRVPVLVILIDRITGRDVIEVVVKSLADAKFKSEIPLGVVYVFESQAKWNGSLPARRCEYPP
jgi:hypothetical protein